MKQLIRLEKQKHSLRGYRAAALTISVFLLGLLYLFAFIPRLEPAEADSAVFSSWHSLLLLHSIAAAAVFAIFSSVMCAKIAVEEYSGRRALLLFLYPVERTRLLDAKLCLAAGETVLSAAAGCAFVYGIFFLSNAFFPICADPLTPAAVAESAVLILCTATSAAAVGILSLWIGFLRRSAVAAIVASCIFVTIVCQAAALSLENGAVSLALPPVLSAAALLARKHLHTRVRQMEV